MNKLLISLLSLVGASAVGTGSYFLLRGNGENSKEKSNEKNDAKGNVNEEVTVKVNNGEAKEAGESASIDGGSDTTIINIPSSQ